MNIHKTYINRAAENELNSPPPLTFLLKHIFLSGLRKMFFATLVTFAEFKDLHISPMGVWVEAVPQKVEKISIVLVGVKISPF